MTVYDLRKDPVAELEEKLSPPSEPQEPPEPQEPQEPPEPQELQELQEPPSVDESKIGIPKKNPGFRDPTDKNKLIEESNTSALVATLDHGSTVGWNPDRLLAEVKSIPGKINRQFGIVGGFPNMKA